MTITQRQPSISTWVGTSTYEIAAAAGIAVKPINCVIAT
jgi:hypothetical protein